MKRKPYEVWADFPGVEFSLAKRARGELPEMESTKQLALLVGEVFQPGMRVLDAGCNVGHYLVGLRRLSADLSYTGIDAYSSYIEQAQQIFAGDESARFEVKSLMDPLFPGDPFDIVYCCNVLLHLPEFMTPVKHLLESTKQVCFIRTLIGEHSTIVRRSREPDTPLEPSGHPQRFIYQNQYAQSVFTNYIEQLGWRVEYIEDTFDPSILQREHRELKKDAGTRIVDGKQVDGNIIFNWKWARITRG